MDHVAVVPAPGKPVLLLGAARGAGAPGPITHITSIPIWLPHSIAWIKQRFDGLPAPENCSSIPPANPLEPISIPSLTANPSAS